MLTIFQRVSMQNPGITTTSLGYTVTNIQINRQCLLNLLIPLNALSPACFLNPSNSRGLTSGSLSVIPLFQRGKEGPAFVCETVFLPAAGGFVRDGIFYMP